MCVKKSFKVFFWVFKKYKKVFLDLLKIIRINFGTKNIVNQKSLEKIQNIFFKQKVTEKKSANFF